jgi:hypothetical protein
MTEQKGKDIISTLKGDNIKENAANVNYFNFNLL